MVERFIEMGPPDSSKTIHDDVEYYEETVNGSI